MIFAILICISTGVLVASWFLYRRNIELFLCLLIAINFEFFYLLPRVKGPDDYKLLLLPILVVLLFESLITRKLALGRYGWWLVCFLGISVLGIIVAWVSGQTLALGIKAAKLLPFVLVYFLVAGREINAEKFIKYFIVMGLAVASIATLQYFVQPRVNLFPGLPDDMLTETRGALRLTMGQFVIAAGAVAAFARYQQKAHTLFLFASIALFLETLLIQQTRVFVAAIILSMFVVYMLSHRLTLFRISLYLILTGLCLGSWLLFSDVNFGSIDMIKRTSTDIKQRKGSYQGRINAYVHYLQETSKRPITGRGILNFNWEGNSENKLQQRGIHLSDIGVTHFIVQAGLIGLIWLIYGLFRLWSDVLHFREQLLISSYFIIATFTLPTLDMLLRRDSLFLFAIFLGLFSSVITDGKTDAVIAEA